MAENSKIEWTTHTFNPWRGCTKVSPGCANCYAETMSGRNPKTLGVWGPNGTRVVASEAMWKEPVKWNDKAGEAMKVWQERSFSDAPWDRPRVFCASLADVFEDWQGPMLDSAKYRLCRSITGESHWTNGSDGDAGAMLTMGDCRTRLFGLIQSTPNLDWLILTKRPEEMAEFVRLATDHIAGVCAGGHFPTDFPNVWLGTSVENVAAKARIDILRDIPAAIRFLSVEPLLEDLGDVDLTGIDWVIVGGESGHGSRPMHPDWVRSLRDQCQATGTAFFFKQFGEWVPDGSGANLSPTRKRIVIGNDGKPRVGGEPNYTACQFVGLNLVGKKAAGRLLDGRTWDEFPKAVTVKEGSGY